MPGEKLSSYDNNEGDNNWEKTFTHPPSEWVYNHTDGPKPEEANPFAPKLTGEGGTIESSESVQGRMSERDMRNISEYNRETEQKAREAVGSILAGDNIKNIKEIAFNNNLRSQFLKEYHEKASEIMDQYKNDFSEEASNEVNRFVADYCSTIYAMDNVNREEGKKLLDVASNKHEISGKGSITDELLYYMQKRQKKGCNVDVAVPIQYSEDNPHPKLEATKVLVWLNNRVNQKELDTSNSTLDLKEQVETKLTGKTAYQRFQERMAARNASNNQ